jgi:hypothetical protein
MTVELRINIEEQIGRVQARGVFREEARYIERTCQVENLHRVIDFGSWCGVLAHNVLATGVPLDNYHLVDCAPIYMEIALAHLGETHTPVTHELVTLVPNSVARRPVTMLVDSYDTLNTSSIYSEHFVREPVKQANVRVPLANALTLNEYVTGHLTMFNSDTYVKIDLDGVDLDLVDSILDNDCLPGAIHFEVWNPFKPRYNKLIERLVSLGYQRPEADFLWHKNFSVGVSRNYWWAVGYDILGGVYRYTYYDKDHGTKPRS